MCRRHRGQSIVEMAFILPLLFVVIFGIIDMGYYVYGYSTLYQAARNGAQKASLAPPLPSKVKPITSPMNNNDECVRNILKEVSSDATLFPNLVDTTSWTSSYVDIYYPRADQSPRPSDTQLRNIGEPIEIRINYPIQPLTPLFKLMNIGTNGNMMVKVIARRSIASYATDLSAADFAACNS